MQLKFQNKGNDAPGNSVPGDLISNYWRVRAWVLETREENFITIWPSVFWSCSRVSKDIEAINGKVRIKLEDGIKSGKILRLKEKVF
jgi:molecular chaperone DnaJ